MEDSSEPKTSFKNRKNSSDTPEEKLEHEPIYSRPTRKLGSSSLDIYWSFTIISSTVSVFYHNKIKVSIMEGIK